MSSPNNLEITGNVHEHPLAELLVEIQQTRLDGSLRLSNHTHKTIIYIKSGEVVFAVSNQRQHRIFEMLLQSGVITKEQLVDIPNFTNDLALIEELKKRNLLSLSEIERISIRQIEVILKDTFAWKNGVWAFSPFARIKEDICHKISVSRLLIDYGRNLPNDSIIRRFKSFKESFCARESAELPIDLLPREAFVLSRFEISFLQIEEIKTLSGLPDLENLQILYALWLGGFLSRKDWDPAFPERRVSVIMSANLELKKQTDLPSEPQAPAPLQSIKEDKQSVADKPPETKPAPVKEAALSLEKYLSRVERAETHYELFNISHRATAAEIKQSYFGLAKLFHPDLFYKKTDAVTHRRIQHAFTEIARAYETLRNEDSRRSYDFKLRKILDALEKQGGSGFQSEIPAPTKNLTEVSEIFEHGFNLLTNEEHEAAIPYLSRAVFLAPETARYRAYYGKAISFDKAQRFKAEAEIQTAVKLEPQNPTFRLMLAEFFVQNNLFKRAEGELGRLLAIFPNNAEAIALLDSLRNK